MDLVVTLRNRISALGEGDYSLGLKAVLLHIETALRHLSRGQDTGDNTAFTDAIYRTNQAFEGGIKEAYRILTGKNPDRKRLSDIEKCLEANNVFRSRVLKQFKTYRDEWRNPSTHDYRLDFDRHEAFLSIVTVSAFSCLLFDQMEEELSFSRSREQAKTYKSTISAKLKRGALLERVANLLREFCEKWASRLTPSDTPSDAEIFGALRALIVTALPKAGVEIDARLIPIDLHYTDMLISEGKDQVNVELKRKFTESTLRSAIEEIETYMAFGNIKDSILLFFPDAPAEMTIDQVEASKGNLRVVRPKAAKPPDPGARGA